ncbi:hypothetical protein Syun_031947 [Stephania yunnanensis]|uniref:Uncharacterized protein n=1 Tax=Stephania yunnanensis TaxID=152371 RepID=A0AAP0DYB8_9MAGN
MSSARAKSRVEQKGKSSFDSISGTNTTVKAWPIDPLDLRNLKLEVSRKVTTGISGLWRPSVHSDELLFDPSMSALPIIVKREFTKCWIVHPPIGNVVGLGRRETATVCGITANASKSESEARKSGACAVARCQARDVGA